MLNAGLDEYKLESRLSGRNINNLRYADDTILMAESEEELKRPRMEEPGRLQSMGWLRVGHH